MSKTDEMTKHLLFMGIGRMDTSMGWMTWGVEFLDPYACGESRIEDADTVEEACWRALLVIEASGWVETNLKEGEVAPF